MPVETYELLNFVRGDFGVPNAYNGRADTFETVGDLFDYVIAHRKPRPGGSCVSKTIFYRLRAALRDVHARQDARVRPDSLTREFFPREYARTTAEKTTSGLGLRFPELFLTTPEWMDNTVLLFTLITWPILIFLSLGTDFFLLALGYPVVPDMLLLLVTVTFPSLNTVPSSEYDTVGKLVKGIVEENYGHLALDRDIWNDDVVWDELRTLVSDFSGYPRHKITRDTHFLRDLKAYTL